MNVLEASSVLFEGRKGISVVRPSTLLSVCSVVIVAMFLFAEVRTVTQMDCMEDTDKFYAFASKIKISTYLITGSGFLFSTHFSGRKSKFSKRAVGFYQFAS
jgi:hypothetical protein